MIKLAIVGGRDYNNHNNFKVIVDNYIKEIGTPSEIVSGGADGVDTMAEKYAKENNINTKIFKPDYDKYGHGPDAPKMRNTEIVAYATHVLALPTVKSRGTYDSINKAKKMNKILKIINV